MTGERLKNPGLTKQRQAGTAAALAMSGLLFGLVYAVVFNFRRDFTVSDFAPHIAWALQMDGRAALSSFYNGQERLWHIFVRMLIGMGVTNIWTAAALVTAAADAAACFLVYKCLDRTVPKKLPRWLLAGLVLCVFLAGSLTLPGHSFYRDRAAVNTWHNPTNIMVRPFAAAVFYMTVDIYDRRRYGGPAETADGRLAFSGGFWTRLRSPVFTRAQAVLYPLCILLSAYAKPSFLQVFAPAVFFFLLADVIRTRGKLLPFCIRLALAYLPAALIVLAQLFRFFGGSVSVGAVTDSPDAAAQAASGIAVYFLQPSFSGAGELLLATARRLLSALYPCAFPLSVLLAAPRRGWKKTSFRLGWLCVAAGLLEMTLLHETGSRAEHGNFSWGFYLSIWLLWTAAAGAYAELLQERGRAGTAVRWVSTPLLAWHVVCGALYVERILRTVQYYF